MSFLATLGTGLYMLMGFLAILFIFIHKWAQGEELNMSNSMTLIAIIFFNFVSVGNLGYMGVLNVANFLKILDRMSEVLKMEEHTSEQDHFEDETE
jgi:hypothetical protein